MVRTLLYVSIFLSAALLFLIQPLFAKYLVPFYGGTSAVWIISISFYSTILLCGYLYASVLTTFPLKTARMIHAILLTASGALLLSQWFMNGTPLQVEPISHDVLAFSTILTLLKGVGLPVLLLASTSVVVQHLFALHTKEDPYWLYALSNAGSLIGLAAFPFLLEPLVDLPVQMGFWVVLFIVYLVVLLGVWRQVERDGVADEANQMISLTLKHRVPIVLYAAVPTFLLASFSELFSRGIASFPLLWVIPLMLYLITFIVTFRDWPKNNLLPPLGFWAFVATLPVIIVLPGMNNSAMMFWMSFGFAMISFFVIVCHFHRSIYLLRPHSGGLGSFYVWLTIGGALGSAVVSVLLPIVSNTDKEIFFGFCAVGIYLTLTQLRWLKKWTPWYVILNIRVMYGVMVALFLIFTTFTWGYIDSERNYYGTVKVYETDREVFGEQVRVRSMVNGITSHGLESLDSRFREQAVSYYGPDSGVELAIRSFQETGHTPSLNVIGLGTGMMNSYCEKVSKIKYVEINPLVPKLAREYFSYLDTCTDKTIVQIADGRIALEQSQNEQYDIIMVDAFSDDAIPIHMLTREAFASAYRPNLTKNGVLVVHISNKYLDLYPVLAGMVDGTDFSVLKVENDGEEGNSLSMTTSWVVIARQEQAEKIAQYENAEYYGGDVIHWTDSRSSILQVLSSRGSF